MTGDHLDVTTPDGRTLEVLTGGDPAGFPWLYLSGSPSAAVPYAPFDRAATDAGLRLVTYSRPGYGGSTARPAPGRIADDVPDMALILDAVGADEFVVLGWSGGGPRSLACAALLPDRCRAAATLAGVAPHDAAGLDWFAGMAPENRAEYAAAEAGADAYAAYLETEFLPVMAAGADDVVAAFGELLSPVDRAATTGELAAYVTDSLHRAGVQGVVGVRDDGLAAVAPWGFDLAAITVPVAVWQGRQDAMVPYAHGVWLAEHVPGATAHLREEEGHLSLLSGISEILADLTRLAHL